MNRIDGPKGDQQPNNNNTINSICLDKGDKFAEYDFSEFKAGEYSLPLRTIHSGVITEEKVTERKVADKGDKNKKKADEKNSNATTTATRKLNKIPV